MHTFLTISKFLRESNFRFEEITFTDEKISARSKDTSKDQNYDPKNSIKTLLVKNKNQFWGIILKGNDKIDKEKLTKIIGKWTIIDKNVLKDKFGFEPGCICPLVLNIPILIDQEVLKLEILSMGAGDIHKGINVKTKNMQNFLKNIKIENITDNNLLIQNQNMANLQKKFLVTEKIFSKFPDAKFGALVIKNLDNTKSNPEINNELDSIIKLMREQNQDKNIDELPNIKKWREVFNSLGLNKDVLPSHEALLRRVLKEGKLPDINPLVNIYNIISLKNLIPIGGHDIDKVKEIRIDETTGDETFQIMNSNENEKINKEEIVYASEEKILTRNFVWRQSDTSKTDKSTKNVFIPIDNALGDMSDDEIKKIATETAQMVIKHLGGEAFFVIINKENNSIEFSKFNDLIIKTDNWFSKYQKIPKLTPSKMAVITDEKMIDKALDRGVAEIIGGREELKKILLSGKKIRLYCGIDPTANFLHVGHFIWLRKLAQFQKLGHEVIFMIGGFTAMIGDPDKLASRKPLTKEEVCHNFQSYEETANRIIDLKWNQNPITMLNNYDWLSQIKLKDWLSVMSSVTMQHILSHEMFATRLKKQLPVRLHEVMYPLMQGFDSVVMNIDLEVGGMDQRFNMLTGRVLNRELQNKEKFIITLKILADNEGVKMGKTTGNAISSKDEASDMFGKIMSWSDGVMPQAFESLTDFDLEQIKKEIETNPMDAKKKLAFSIVSMVKRKNEALEAQKHFEKTVQSKETPDEIPVLKTPHSIKLLDLIKLIQNQGFLQSVSEGRRLAEQGGFQIDGVKMQDIEEQLDLKSGQIIKIGKRKFVKIAL